jgi:uncharacterized protein (UPF0147 family)
MDEQISELVEMLDMLGDDMHQKARVELDLAIEGLKAPGVELDTPALMKVQDQLEGISNMSNLDTFARNEIINTIAIIETIYN